MTCFGDAATCRVYVFMLYHLQLGRLTGQLTYLPARHTKYAPTHAMLRITETYNKEINLLTYNFSKEQYMLPEDDLRIETCRSVLDGLV